jgi:isoleucyl-tRNA synthetase
LLGAIAKAGHIEPGLKPVNWCLDCGSALAEAEVEYEDKKSDAIDVGFTVVDLKDLSARLGVDVQDVTDIVIWTTTPWTLPANQAVALHAEIDYQLVQVSTDRGCKTLFLPKIWLNQQSSVISLKIQWYWLILKVQQSRMSYYNIL